MTDQDEARLLARLDERTQRILADVSSMRRELEQKYTTNDQFVPVRNVVYGLVALILLSVVGALVSMVVIK